MPLDNTGSPASHEDELAQLLAMALDRGDETRILMMTRLILMNLDPGRDADLDRLRQSVTTPRVVRL